MIYLDNAATTFPKPNEVYDALDFAHRNLSFNAGRGSYKKSQECLEVLNDLRKEIASFCDADFKNITLLSSATEALNLIINGLDLKKGSNIYITPFEHNAIIRPLYNIKKSLNMNIFVLPFDKETWKPDITKIENMFALNNPDVIFSSQISNVTGLKIEYSSIFEMGKKYSATTILDAAQGFGVVALNTKCVDFTVFAGHKSLYGPFGIGGFINFTDKNLKVVKSGGTGSDTLNHDMPLTNHERYESGSPNVPAAYATLIGARWVKQADIKNHEDALINYLVDKLKKIEKVILYLPKNVNDIFGIVSLSVEGYSADDVGTILSDEFDICVRTGYHCAPLVHEFINSTIYKGTVRISISNFTTKSDIDSLIDALTTL